MEPGNQITSDAKEVQNVYQGLRSRPHRRRRPKLIVVVGLWMLFFPTAIFSAYVAGDILLNYRTRSNLYVFWLAVGSFLLTASILYRITRNYLVLAPFQETTSEQPFGLR